MRFLHVSHLPLCLSVLLLAGCSSQPPEQEKWGYLNYSQTVCTGHETSAGCTYHEEENSIGRSKGGKR